MFFRSVWLLFSMQGKWCGTCGGYKQQTLVQELDVSYEALGWLLLASLPAWECCSECSHCIVSPAQCLSRDEWWGCRHRGAACSPLTCATAVSRPRHYSQPVIECSLYTSWLLAYNCTWLVVNKPLTSSCIVWYVFMKISLTFVSTEECRYIICTFHNHKIQRADSNTNMYVY